MNALDLKFKEYIQDHLLESKKSANEISLAIQNSDLNLGNGYYTRTLHIPKFFSKEDEKNFERIVNTTYTIFSKVIAAYKKDEKIRALFPFSKELEELILLPAMYETDIPICRIDIFYNEDSKDFGFCEFNTDGTSAMNEIRRLNSFLELNNAYEHFKPKGEVKELMHSWVEAFMKNYKQTSFKDQKPSVAITDFLENAYITDLNAFSEIFREHGIDAEVVDIRDFDYKDGVLFNKKTGKAYNAIYRRAVTKDVMEHYEEIQPFIQAVKDGNVVLEGSFQTQIPHHKVISQVLADSYMQSYFTKEEIEFIHKHLPKTYDLTGDAIDLALSNKNKYIVKPKDSYAAKGVFAGVDLHKKEWEKVVKDFTDKDYILQEYVPPFKSENIDLINFNEFYPYSNLTGLYVYNGKFSGVYSRLSDSGIISSQYNEKAVPTIFLED